MLIWSDHFLSTGNQQLKEVAVCDCESDAVTLVRCQFWPGSPERPSVGFHFKLMDLAEKTVSSQSGVCKGVFRIDVGNDTTFAAQLCEYEGFGSNYPAYIVS